MKTVVTCSNNMILPEGAEPTENAEDYGCDACEYIMGNKLHRCNKFIGLEGTNPQTGEDIKDDYKCTDTWAPILAVHIAGTNRGQTAALESFRNEMVKTNRQMVQALTLGAEAIKDQPKLRSTSQSQDTTLLDK